MTGIQDPSLQKHRQYCEVLLGSGDTSQYLLMRVDCAQSTVVSVFICFEIFYVIRIDLTI